MVSVIVPVYNVEKVLHYCVDSILNQTYTDFELILVDDGSTDNSGMICDEYSKKDIRVAVVHIENGGVSKARNKGIELAKGDYICFVDSDDYISANYLEELITTKEEFPDYDSVWCGFQTVSDYKEADLKINIFSEEEVYSKLTRKDIMTLHEKWLSQMPWNKLFKTDTIKNNSICFREDLSLGEDVIFNLDYLNHTNGKIIIVNKALNYYLRSGSESLDNKYYNDLRNIYGEINKTLLKYVKKWNCNKRQVTLYYNSCFYSYEKVLRNTFHPQSIINNKYKYNKQIMKSIEFKEVLEKSDCYINTYYRFAYEHSSYVLVRVLERLAGLKKVVLGVY